MRTTKKTFLLKSFFKNSNFQDMLFSVLIFVFMTIIITNPHRFTAGTVSGLKLFFFSVLPGLFPFMFLTKLLTEIGFLFKISKRFNKFSYKLFGTPGVSIYAMFMSILSGYPIGSKIISDLYEKHLITQKESQKMSVFCTTSGPIFVIGTVGIIMFGSVKIGIILYISHILSSILLGIIYNLLSKDKQQCKSYKNIIFQKQKNIFAICVNQTINSLFTVGAYITIFFLFAEILDTLGIFNLLINILSPLSQICQISKNNLSGILHGILEVTMGSKTLSSNKTILSVSFCSMLISFSGISIIMQSMAFLKNAQIKTRNFILSKCVHSIVSFFIWFFISFDLFK